MKQQQQALGEKPLKQPKMKGETEVKRQQDPPPLPDHSASTSPQHPGAEESVPRTVTTLKKSPPHPKGHRVKALKEIWNTLDAGEYIRCTDTYSLNDVWMQPTGITTLTKNAVLVKFRQLVTGLHIKEREVQNKMYCDDVLKIFYLADQYENEFVDRTPQPYDGWLKSVVAYYVQEAGVEEVDDRAKLVKFLFDHKRVNFFPCAYSRRLQTFFRKISCHSYKAPGAAKTKNPSLFKCEGARGGNFEYCWEARIIWTMDEIEGDDDLPSTQKLPDDI